MPTSPINSTARFSAAGAVAAAMLLDRLGDLPADRQHRVERGHRLLEHHADLAAAHLAHLVVGKLHQVAAVEHNLARDDAPRRARDQPQDGQRADRFARAALADDGDCFSRIDRIGDAVDRAHDPGAGAKLGTQVADFQERRQRRFSPQTLNQPDTNFVVAPLVAVAMPGCQSRRRFRHPLDPPRHRV